MLWIALPLLLLQSPSAAPRDAPPPQTGTGTIAGRVTAADTAEPMRRAIVYLSMSIVRRTVTDGHAMIEGQVGRPRSVATRADGRYEFSGLPPGSYSVQATPGPTGGAYVPRVFGGDDTARGKQIELADGQRFQADIALQRGGVIVGRVADESGEPLARAWVQPSQVRAGELQHAGRGVQTDDHGRFRLYGLMPGEYVVSAEARNYGPGEGASEGFAPTFFPSTLNEREASRVRVATGLEPGDVEIRMVRTRTFRITGTVVDSRGAPVAQPHVMLVRQTWGRGSFGSSGGFDSSGPSSTGRFAIRDVVPGDYRLVVQPGRTPGEHGPVKQPPVEYAVVPVTVTADIEDIVLMTRPGVSVGGQVIFAEGIPPKPVSRLHIGGEPAEAMSMVGGAPPVAVDESMQFTLTDLFGPQLVRVMGLMPPFALKAVMLGATDITDTPTEFRPEHRLQVVVTARASRVEGTVSDDAGRPGANALVIALPEDKRSWRGNSQRLRMTAASPEGKFVMPGLVDGRYYLVALPADSFHFSPWTPSDAFAALAREGTLIALGEDETRMVDLRLTKDVPRQ